MKGMQGGAVLVSLTLLGACGGSASRNGVDLTPSEGGAGAGAGAFGGPDGPGGAPQGGGGPVGGSAMGGAVSGSGPSNPGGAGQTGGTGGLSLPAGCEARQSTETDTSCSLSAYCPGQSQITSCTRLASGRWQCGCELVHRERMFEVEGTAGLQACAVAAGACGADESAMGEESCATRYDDSREESCLINVGCRREVVVPFAPEARAWLVRDAEADCRLDESGAVFDCGCTYRGAHQQYQLLAEQASQACRPFIEFCMSEVEPDFSGEERCLVVHRESDGDGCQHAVGCANPLTLAAGVDLVELETHWASCVPGVAGGADCFCSTRKSESFAYRTDDAPDAASCAAASDACEAGTELVATGTVSCEPELADVLGNDGCTAELACEQPATVAGDAIIARGRLLVWCAREDGDEPWRCACASNQSTASFSLGALGASPAEACQQAPTGCIERLDVHLGPYGELVYPPDPLSP